MTGSPHPGSPHPGSPHPRSEHSAEHGKSTAIHDSEHAQSPAASLVELIHERDAGLVRRAASDRRLTEDMALELLERRDLPHGVLEELAKNAGVMKHRKVLNALVAHPRTPRHVSLPIVRRLYTFELMQIALLPSALADLKMFAEEQLLNRLESISAGERLTLAKRGSTRIAAALLLDAERRVIEAALENPYLTEAWIVKGVMSEKGPGKSAETSAAAGSGPPGLEENSGEDSEPYPAIGGGPQGLIEAVCRHPKWSMRREIRCALLKNQYMPMPQAVEFAQQMSSFALREVLRSSRLPENVKSYLQHLLEERKSQ